VVGGVVVGDVGGDGVTVGDDVFDGVTVGVGPTAVGEGVGTGGVASGASDPQPVRAATSTAMIMSGTFRRMDGTSHDHFTSDSTVG
jgi:hypothetical protein